MKSLSARQLTPFCHLLSVGELTPFATKPHQVRLARNYNQAIHSAGIILDHSLWPHFTRKARQAAFWVKPAPERHAIWGPSTDPIDAPTDFKERYLSQFDPLRMHRRSDAPI